MVIGLGPVKETSTSVHGVGNHADDDPMTASETIVFEDSVLLAPLKPTAACRLLQDLVAGVKY